MSILRNLSLILGLFSVVGSNLIPAEFPLVYGDAQKKAPKPISKKPLPVEEKSSQPPPPTKPISVNPAIDPGPIQEPETREPEITVQRVLPAGMRLPILLYTPVNSQINRQNDLIEAAIAQDVYLGSQLLLSKHDRLRGYIFHWEPALEGRNALIGVRFTELILSNGEHVGISAHVKTARQDHLWGGELTPGTEWKRVTYRVAGIGAYNKAVLGGPRQMGQEITFKPGEAFTAVLDNPVTIQ